MTVQQKIAQNFSEVEERREAAIQKVDLDKVVKVVIGIQELFCEYSQKEDVRNMVNEVEVHYYEEHISVVAITADGKFSSNETSDGHHNRLINKIQNVSGIHIKDSEDIFLKKLIGKHHTINILEAGKRDFSVMW